MEYPKRLLPTSHHKILDLALVKDYNLWLVRHHDGDKKMEYIGGTNTLDPKSLDFPSERMRDLSNNLLGVFKKDDVGFCIKKPFREKFCADWDGITNCEVPNEEEFEFLERDRYFLNPGKLDEYDEKFIIGGEKGEPFHFVMLHTPSKCNFWHVSIRLCDSQNITVSDLGISKNMRKKIWKSAKDFILLCDVIVADVENFDLLPSECYLINNGLELEEKQEVLL